MGTSELCASGSVPPVPLLFLMVEPIFSGREIIKSYSCLKVILRRAFYSGELFGTFGVCHCFLLLETFSCAAFGFGRVSVGSDYRV